MTTKTKAVAAVLVVLVAVALLVWRCEGPAPEPSTAKTAAPPDATKPVERPSRRARGEKGAGAVETETPTVVPVPLDATAEQAKWPIRVTTTPGAKVTVTVQFSAGDPDPPPVTKTADAAGFAGFGIPERADPPAGCAVVARADGFMTRRDDGEIGEFSLVLEPGVAIRGHVVDDAGRPVAEAIVQGVETGGLSDETGAFEAFTSKPGGMGLVVDHRAFVHQIVPVTAPSDSVRIVLARGLSVSGRITFPDGSPVPGASITNGSLGTSTGDDGRYSLTGLAPGPVEVACDVTGEKRTADAGATGIDFVVRRPVARVRIVDAEGRPFRRASMWMRMTKDGQDLLTSASAGSQELETRLVAGVPGARLLVSPSAAGYDETIAGVTFGDEAKLHDLDVVVTRGAPKGRVRLVVIDEEGRRATSGHLSLNDEGGSPYHGWYAKAVTFDAAGAVEIDDLMPGVYEAVAESGPRWSLEGYVLATRVEFRVLAGQTTDAELHLALGGRIRVVVRNEAGAVVKPERLDLLDPDGKRYPLLFLRATEDGTTTELAAAPATLASPVKAGRYVVAATGPDGDIVKKEVEVLRGQTADLEIVVAGR